MCKGAEAQAGQVMVMVIEELLGIVAVGNID